MYRDPKVIRDGWPNLWGGVDSGRAANLLEQNQCAFAVNVSMRGGYPETRPPFVTPNLTFQRQAIADHWAQSECQGADYFAPTQREAMIVAMIGGRMYRIDVIDDFKVTDITPVRQTRTAGAFISPPIGSSITISITDGSLIQIGMEIIIGDGTYIVTGNSVNVLTAVNETAIAGVNVASGTPVQYPDTNPVAEPIAWIEQADKWLVVQDGKSSPILYDGAIVRRATNTEVPTGTAMVFNEEIGRLAVALVTNQIAIGDILNPISFTETGYLNEGGKFQIPKRFGAVTGACMMANQDRSNGQGAMLFFTENGISAFALPPNREQWKNVQFPLQIAMPIFGATSHHSIVNVNGDVFYRGKDGFRSFALTRQEFGQWGNTPISRELGRVLDGDDRKLLRFATSCLFDNRLLFTAMPRNGACGAYHEAICVMDFEGVSALRRLPPRFDGIWTGIKPQHFVVGNFGGEERCFAFCRGENGGVQLWEILRRGDFDGDGAVKKDSDGVTLLGRITSRIESRALEFGNPFQLTRLDGFEMWVDNVVGTVDFDLKHKADLGPCWANWGTKKICETFKDCANPADGCNTVHSYRPGQRSRLGFGQPPDTNENVIDNRPMRVGYNHELRLQWTGRARVKWAIAKAVAIPEDANPPIETEEA